MTKSKLKLNPDNSEFLIIVSKKQPNIFSTFLSRILWLDYQRSPSNSARNIGVIFDCDLIFRHHIFRSADPASTMFVICVAFTDIFLMIQLRWLDQLALIGSRPNYCNSPFYDISAKAMIKCQRVHNFMARVEKPLSL